MPEFADEVTQHPVTVRLPRPHRVSRLLTGFSALGVAAGLIVTGAGASSAAPTAQAAPKIITLTSSASGPTGHLTVQFKYEVERGGERPVSVTYSGGSKLDLKDPALVFSLLPVPGLPLVHRHKTQVEARHRFPVIVRIRDPHHLAGTLPVRDLPRLEWAFAEPHRRLMPPAGALLEATLASVVKRTPLCIRTAFGPQVGVLLSLSRP